jgi:hypothetical protein
MIEEMETTAGDTRWNSAGNPSLHADAAIVRDGDSVEVIETRARASKTLSHGFIAFPRMSRWFRV